jgi:phenylpropionate dioxygenase-like ring-hydroxylating dioxygenase large terminal subunit
MSSLTSPAAAAQTPEALLPRLYLDESLLDAEQELIFERTWQLAGHVSALPRPGSYLTARAGNQPVLVLRDEENRLVAFRNICRHRASRLLSGSGQCKGAIRCRYHGWTYRFDGSLIGVPEGMTYGERLKKSTLGLFPVRVEEFCGLIFVNLDPDAVPLAEQLPGLRERLEPYCISALESFAQAGGTLSNQLRQFVPRPRHPAAGGGQPANWKVVVENYIEGYHIPIAHPGLMRLLDYKHYEAEVHDNYVWFDAPLRAKPSSNRIERLYAQLVEPMPGLPEESHRVWRYAFIYPNTTIDLYPDQVNTWQILPDGVGRTTDVFANYRPVGSSPRTRFVQWLNQRLNNLVLDEDVELVDNVQQGAATRGYVCGPLSRREAAVGWFADRVRSDLASVLTR